MPQRTDKFDANALPDPELNPLLNPLLAAHMGRWAEVYFTNPPEKREQAISELLRELENTSPPDADSVQAVHAQSETKETEMTELLESAPAEMDSARTCAVCAHSNSAEQRFCGMCGAPLQISPEAHVPQVSDDVPIAGGSWCERSVGTDSREEEDAIEAPVRFAEDDPRSVRYASLGLTSLLPENNPPNQAEESERAPRNYWLYAGVVLAILLVVLVYRAWRGTTASSTSASPQSATSRAILSEQPAPTPSAQQPNTTQNAVPTGIPPASPVQDQTQPAAKSRKEPVAEARSMPQIVPVAAGSAAVSSSTPTAQSGAEELAMAEKYLNGSQGVTRDNEEAVQWLWKAVRKRNMAATMALSDLYLRGDGVAKSCDQARVLLDAAARKGGKAAAERLRNLRAFGCE